MKNIKATYLTQYQYWYIRQHIDEYHLINKSMSTIMYMYYMYGYGEIRARVTPMWATLSPANHPQWYVVLTAVRMVVKYGLK